MNHRPATKITPPQNCERVKITTPGFLQIGDFVEFDIRDARDLEGQITDLANEEATIQTNYALLKIPTTDISTVLLDKDSSDNRLSAHSNDPESNYLPPLVD